MEQIKQPVTRGAYGAHATPVDETLYGAMRTKLEGEFVDLDWPKDVELHYGGRKLDQMDILAMRLGMGQVPMRNRRAIMRPKKLVVMLASAGVVSMPPALVVQFDNLGRKTTFAVPA